MKKLHYDGQEYFLPYAEMFRPLTKEEDERLRQSINSFGVMEPVIVDETNNVISGANRLRIGAEEKKKVPIVRVKGLSEEQKQRMAEDANVAHRMLSKADIKQKHKDRLRRIGTVSASRSKGESLRIIAEKMQLSVTQVQRDLQEARDLGIKCDPPDEVTTKSGRKQTSKPKKKPRKADAAPVSSEKDRRGRVIPDNLKDVFADTWHAAALQAFQRIRKEVASVMKWSVWLDPAFIDELKVLESRLEVAIPHHVCQECGGAGEKEDKTPCGECRGSGYLSIHHK